MTDNQRAVTEEQLKIALEPITREVNDMRYAIADIKKVVTGNGSGIGLDEQARNNRRDIDRHEAELGKVKELLSPIVIFYKVGVWFASLIGVSVIALIWAIITHEVTIGIP